MRIQLVKRRGMDGGLRIGASVDGTIAPIPGRSPGGRPVRPRQRLWLSFVGVLLAVAPSTARSQPDRTLVPPPMPVLWRLSVRPREMATGTHTERAGFQKLEVQPGVQVNVYVPPGCVGTRRCPLIVCMAWSPGCDNTGIHRLADAYGMLLLEASWMQYPGSAVLGDGWGVSVDPGVPYLLRETNAETAQYIQKLDAALKRVLQTFAIDPAKIAVFGNSAGGVDAALVGSANPDVFSRIAPRTGYRPYEGPIPSPKTTQFYYMASGAEFGEPNNALFAAQFKRQEGYPVRIVIAPKLHTPGDLVELGRLFRWFHDSWAAPAVARRTAWPRHVPPMLRLTRDAVTRWDTFWTRFMQEPDSIRDTARMAEVREVPILLGREPIFTLLTDIPAMAARSPAVAADLKAAGLTAQQAAAYRIALFSAWLTLRVQQYHVFGDLVGPVAPTSVLGQNMAFLRAQPALLQTLNATKANTDRTWINNP